MSITRKLDKWREAGVIDAATAQAIMAYESSRSGLRFGSALLGLGALAIFLGIAAIVSSNWAHISGPVKLSTHALINLLVGGGLFWAYTRGKDTAQDILAFLLAGLTLTFIALIGQVYQTDAPLWQALSLWLGLISPFYFVCARGRFTVTCWILSFIVLMGSLIDPVRQILPHGSAAFYVFVLFVFYGLSQTKSLARHWGKWTNLLESAHFVLLSVTASIAQFLWSMPFYVSRSVNIQETSLYGLMAGLAGWVLVWGLRQTGTLDHKDFRTDLFIGISVLAIFIPPLVGSTLPPHTHSLLLQVIGAASFMAYWALAGWTGLCAGMNGILRLSVVMIAARLVGVYADVFGSLLTTGIGLIISGLLLMLLVFIVRKILRRLPAAGARA